MSIGKINKSLNDFIHAPAPMWLENVVFYGFFIVIVIGLIYAWRVYKS